MDWNVQLNCVAVACDAHSDTSNEIVANHLCVDPSIRVFLLTFFS